VTGKATLGGTLNVTLVGGFVPAVGSAYQILTFGSRSGDFATENGLTMPDGHHLVPSYSGTGLLTLTDQ
jgi:hypothetical protein